MRRRTAVTTSVAAVLAGTAIAVGVPLAWTANSNPSEASFGAGLASRLAETPAARQPASTAPSARKPSVPLSPPAASPPVRLSVAGAGIAAPVVPVGVEPSGAVVVPENVRTVGWYRFSSTPGATSGSIVLVGHVDSAQQGRGAFFRLHAVSAGDRISLATRSGTYDYVVVARESFPKSAAPLADLFTANGAPRLTLITCGGSFDALKGSYRENVVVTAVPSGTVKSRLRRSIASVTSSRGGGWCPRRLTRRPFRTTCTPELRTTSPCSHWVNRRTYRLPLTSTGARSAVKRLPRISS